MPSAPAIGSFHHTTLGQGTTVLVNGAAGAVGTAAVQLAKAAGAEVTAVCRGSDEPMVTAFGADRVIDYTITDFATGDVIDDVIVDCVGNAGFDRVGAVLAPGGALALADAGAFAAVRDTTYDLADVVVAHGHDDQGHKKGKVALRIAAPSAPHQLQTDSSTQLGGAS